MLVGRPVLLAGFPAVTDQDFSGQPEGQPMVTTGSICSIDRDLELAAAAYQEGRNSAAAAFKSFEELSRAFQSWDLHSLLVPGCQERCLIHVPGCQERCLIHVPTHS